MVRRYSRGAYRGTTLQSRYERRICDLQRLHRLVPALRADHAGDRPPHHEWRLRYRQHWDLTRHSGHKEEVSAHVQ
jgi:hypothetical protein